ncbi:hypothetical protein B0H19DRAFT_1201765 [Mycena capillaripes]|nr:hypothetical protein B0H19DRAFT_1201765 [Mycena capillaripes]
MAELPKELLHAITKDVEHDPSIFSLRLVSKTLNAIASPLALRVVVMNDSVKSAEAVSFLQGCDESTTSLVREVVFRGDPNSEVQNDWREKSSGDSEAAREALKTTFSGLAKFRNLEVLRLNFHNCYQEDITYDTPEEPTHFLLLQNELFATLAANPPLPLVSLILNNVLAVPDAIYAENDFHQIFLPLQELEISVLSDVDYEGSYFQEPLVDFWKDSVAHMVRSATAVTALTICSDQPVGAYPALSFKDMSFPRLASLSLHQFVFSDSDVVEFILRHKATLTRLELHDCSIDGGENGDFSHLWYAVLTRFEVELHALRAFVFENGTEREEDAFERDPRFEEIAGEHQDLPALESLMAVVASRVG